MLNDSLNQNGYMNASNASISIDNRTANSNRGQNCVPVMICQINRYKDKIQLWGMPVRTITIVAIVKEIEALSSKISFYFQDETGSIRGVKWLRAEEKNYVSPVSKNSYARVYGNMRLSDDDPFINIVEVRPIDHLNELMAHLMEITVVCLEGKEVNYISSITEEPNIEVKTEQTTDVYPLNLNKEQATVYNIIKCAKDRDAGIERQELKSHVPPYLINKVDEILEFLSSEGHVYTTITDDHYTAV